jgi:H+/Cl- antiporter ClcA
VTELRTNNPWILYLLPFIGLLIVFIYKFEKQGGGTNLVLESVEQGKTVPFRMAPMIFAATVLTHFGGGSAGREGAALQLGGSIAQTIGKAFKLDEKNTKIMIMCGMAAGFSSLFGTPLAATVFAIEVVTVGVVHYSALVPCAIASLTAFEVAHLCGGHAESFPVHNIPEFALKGALLIGLLALLCALLSVVFCKTLHEAEHLYKKYIKNPYIRIFVGGVLVIILAKLLGTTDYLGGGMNIVERAVEGEVIWCAFILKLLFTAVSLGAGFKGGEIVPTLFALDVLLL